MSLASAGDIRPGPLVLAPVRIPAATKRGTVRAAPYHAGFLLGQRGHHRIKIDPAAASDQAIGSYATVGFRAVGVMRQYGRGGDGRFPDGLLMDLLRGELADDR